MSQAAPPAPPAASAAKDPPFSGADRFFENARGVALHEALYEPAEGAARRGAAVLFVHGMGEDALTHDALGAFLSRRGVECRLLDLQGFGRSGGERGHIGSYEDFLGDLAQWAQRVRGERPQAALYLGGHSFGSAIAGLAAQRLEAEAPGLLAGYLASSPPFALRALVHQAIARANPGQTQTKVPGHKGPERAPAKARRLVVTPPSRPGLDPTVTRRFAKNFDLAMEAFGRIGRLPGRVLVLMGEKDPVLDREGPARVRERLGHRDFQIRVLEGRRHNLLLGSRAPQVFGEIASWVG